MQKLIEKNYPKRGQKMILIPEWGLNVCIMKMNSEQREQFETFCKPQTIRDKQDHNLALVIHSAVDIQGQLVFRDIAILKKRKPSIVEMMVEIALEKNRGYEYKEPKQETNSFQKLKERATHDNTESREIDGQPSTGTTSDDGTAES